VAQVPKKFAGLQQRGLLRLSTGFPIKALSKKIISHRNIAKVENPADLRKHKILRKRANFRGSGIHQIRSHAAELIPGAGNPFAR